MKVLVLAPPVENVGGVQSFTAALVRSLQELLGEAFVHLLAIVPNSPPAANWAFQATKNGGDRPAFAAKARFIKRALWEGARWGVDLCLCVHIGVAPVGRLLRLLAGCPYWVAAHGIEVWGALSYAKQRALREADRILAVSSFTRQRLIERHLLSPARVEVFPNAVDVSLVAAPAASDPLARLGVFNRQVVLTVGRLAASERYKGHDVILRALPAVLAQRPDVVYLIVGDGDDRLRLEALARALGVQDHVKFLGTATGAELAACYRACDVFALPARTVLDDRAPKGEGFGIAFLEAMAFGKPLVGPNHGAPIEFIRNGENGLLVDPEGPREVAAALLTLLSQPELARHMGKSGRRLVEQQYSLEAMKRRLESMFALEAHPGR